MADLNNKELSNDEKKEIRDFLSGNPIITVQSGIIKADHNGTAIENARNWAELHKQVIIRKDIGNVIFNKKGIKNSLSHGFGQRKLDAIQAVPEAIKSGKIVKISNDLERKKIKKAIPSDPRHST